MGPDPSWVVIVNPASANGRTGRDWKRHESLLRSLLPPFEVWPTTYPGHARELAQQAVDRGFSVIAVHGGDGTFNEVVNGFFPLSAKGTSLAFLPYGTGADLVRTLGISHVLPEAARQARGGTIKPVDLGSVEFIDLEGRPARRYFVNVTDVGFGGDLVRYVNSHSKRLGGKLSFFKGLLVTLFRYMNKQVRITMEEGEGFEQRASSIVVANGQYFGGGMWVAPEARLDDGLFELVVIGDVTKREVLSNVGLLYRGTIATHPKVKTFKTKSIHMTSAEEVMIDLDGELVGRLPACFHILPGALSVIR
ncbi:MAG: diacylglycerol kinase family protein [Thermodesulfobacteriota bacterium]